MTTERLATMAKDPSIYPSFSEPMAGLMTAELDQFYDDVLWNGAGSLRELFTSNRSFVDSTLAGIYGIPWSPLSSAPGQASLWPNFTPAVTTAAPASSNLQLVSLDSNIRPGILTRPGFLTVHADSDSSGPIVRGVFLLGSIFCSPPSPPPANIPRPPPPTDPSVQNITTRQRFANHAQGSCAGCHNRIDGIGFGFEEFDGLGAYRTVENGQPVDSSGVVIGTGEIDGPFNGAAELANKLAGSRVLADCYASQAYRYAMGQVEDSAADIAWLLPASTPDAKMTDVLLAIVKNQAFSERAVE